MKGQLAAAGKPTKPMARSASRPLQACRRSVYKPLSVAPRISAFHPACKSAAARTTTVTVAVNPNSGANFKSQRRCNAVERPPQIVFFDIERWCQHQYLALADLERQP